MKNKVTSTKYRLKQCFVWLVGDTLYNGSRSKWNLWLNKIASSVDQQAKPWTLSHTRSCTCRMLEVPPPPPPPQMDRSQNMSADYWATGPFHFGLGKAAVLNDFPCSTFIVDQTLSIWCNEAYSCLFSFSCPTQPNHIIICFNQRNHWNSWENHHNHQLYSEWSQN